MSNLPQEHHRLNTHARHRAKALTALLWTARFRWTASAVIDDLLGGNGLVRKLVKQKLLVEHPIASPFSPVRYYVTLAKEGLDLLQRHWSEIGCSVHGEIATRLSDSWELPARPEQRIREARFEHDLHLQYVVLRVFHSGRTIETMHLCDDLERTPPTKRPSKIPDVILELRPKNFPTDRTPTKIWHEIEFSRKNRREIDMFCTYYRAAIAGTSKRQFDRLIVYCHPSVLAQWRRDFARTIVPAWNYRKDTRNWVKLDEKDWHHFPPLSADVLDKIIRPLRSLGTAPRRRAHP